MAAKMRLQPFHNKVLRILVRRTNRPRWPARTIARVHSMHRNRALAHHLVILVQFQLFPAAHRVRLARQRPSTVITGEQSWNTHVFHIWPDGISKSKVNELKLTLEMAR